MIFTGYELIKSELNPENDKFYYYFQSAHPLFFSVVVLTKVVYGVLSILFIDVITPKQTTKRGEVMPKAKNPKAVEAEALFLQGMKLIDISKKLDLPEGTVRRWKSTYKWRNERSEKKASVRNKGGAPKGNKNAVGDGAPPENKNAV